MNTAEISNAISVKRNNKSERKNIEVKYYSPWHHDVEHDLYVSNQVPSRAEQATCTISKCRTEK